MKFIQNMKQLEPFGIIPLTGESDQHVYRILCDVTAKGKAFLERTLDVNLQLADAWNYGNKDDPHLPQEFVPCLAVFALLSEATVRRGVRMAQTFIVDTGFAQGQLAMFKWQGSQP